MIIMARHTPLQLLILFAFVIVIGQSRTVPNNNDTDIRNNDEIELRKSFFLEEIYLYTYYSSGFNGSWISDNEFIVGSIITGDITITNVKTKETRQIFNGTDLPLPYKLSTATISADKQYILFGYNTRRVFRHSTVKNYVVYDIQDGTFEEIENGTFISLALWSPIGSDLVYVFDNDIYHMTFNRSQNVVRRLTTSGEANIVFNGIPDWVYEEEVFGSATAMWFSPDGQHLAFATFNDTVVKDMAYFHYGTPGSLEDQYPTEVKIKYPKVGTPNPVVSLSVIDLFDPLSEAVILEAPINEVTSGNILYIVSWWDETHVLATWTNRVQNQSQMTMYDIQGDAKLVLSDEETEGWLQPNLPIRTRDYILLLRREPSGTSAGRFRHINRYEYKDGQFIMPLDLTPGPSEVHAILAADSPRGKVYYLATAPGEPSQRNLYSVPLDGSQKPTCISCKLLTPEGNKCTYATASFSSWRSYYAFICSGPDPATVTINDNNHQSVLIWNTNQDTRARLSRRLMPQQKDFNVTVNGYDCRVRLFLPPDFDESKSYPMMVFVYGGPNTVRIVDDAKYGYEYYLTTNRSMVHAWIDGRGSAFKGSNMLFEIYRKLGTVEIEDTIAVTEILQKQYSWIDANRTGIWGWSYGGFTTGMVMAQDTNFVFKCGISVAPVTSWIYYDSIYTERLMGLPTPEDNLDGYNRTDISQRSEGIRGKKYMLIHGTGDDNVHYQQALALAKSLEYKDILFEQVTYTDEAHSLENVSPHLYHTMDKFWCECFGWGH
ncbi:PREDICTED: venom dipeptidyl peptidase 4 [Trachymyrmex septentrionalis]|uniref:venom dipeptidyl peptidase 4 n=1 Tax=Trachymyrmex septentrionalis TaxID=34720 RepID=UPI00084F058F|nr:PREDICTED: venom dipeptidyl peptidase 4 [Trachymyrmex septentrionalis]